MCVYIHSKRVQPTAQTGESRTSLVVAFFTLTSKRLHTCTEWIFKNTKCLGGWCTPVIPASRKQRVKETDTRGQAWPVLATQDCWEREIRSQKLPGEKGSHRSISPTPWRHGIPLDILSCLPHRRKCWKQEADTRDYHGTNRVGTSQRGRFHEGDFRGRAC